MPSSPFKPAFGGKILPVGASDKNSRSNFLREIEGKPEGPKLTTYDRATAAIEQYWAERAAELRPHKFNVAHQRQHPAANVPGGETALAHKTREACWKDSVQLAHQPGRYIPACRGVPADIEEKEVIRTRGIPGFTGKQPPPGFSRPPPPPPDTSGYVAINAFDERRPWVKGIPGYTGHQPPSPDKRAVTVVGGDIYDQEDQFYDHNTHAWVQPHVPQPYSSDAAAAAAAQRADQYHQPAYALQAAADRPGVKFASPAAYSAASNAAAAAAAERQAERYYQQQQQQQPAYNSAAGPNAGAGAAVRQGVQFANNRAAAGSQQYQPHGAAESSVYYPDQGGLTSPRCVEGIPVAEVIPTPTAQSAAAAAANGPIGGYEHVCVPVGVCSCCANNTSANAAEQQHLQSARPSVGDYSQTGGAAAIAAAAGHAAAAPAVGGQYGAPKPGSAFTALPRTRQTTYAATYTPQAGFGSLLQQELNGLRLSDNGGRRPSSAAQMAQYLPKRY